MIGERLAEVRRDYGENQNDLAEYLHVSLATIRSWEQGKSAPSHESLVAICKRYHISSDYLLGLTDADLLYLQHKVSVRLTKNELKALQDFSNYLMWKRSRQK